MKSLLLLSVFVIIVWTGLALGKHKANDPKDKILRFGHTSYVIKVKESHKLWTTVKFLKTSGCHDKKITYSVQEMNVPFQIDEHSGRIFLSKTLDYSKKKMYTFIVNAVGDKGKCKAMTIVRAFVLNANKHRPQFHTEKYHCRIQEKTGRVKISPIIKVDDLDHGEAGQIANVQVVESNEPFSVELKQKTGEVLVKSDENYKFDANRISEYKFSLIAWDAGSPQKNSPVLKLHCKVVPLVAQNKYTPVFTKQQYIGRVKQGEVTPKIVKVEATDADVNALGKVCEYFIRTSDIPFDINNKGVISLSKPLANDAPDSYVFVVMAKDCGGRMSEDGAMVDIIVDKDCIPGLVAPAVRTPKLKNCDGLLKLTPQIRLNRCGESRQYANYTARVSMQTLHILKGCDRETYEASGVFKMCKVNKTIDLLPAAKRNHKWMAALLTAEDEGSNVHYFDKKTAINVPSDVIQYNGNEKMTISTWIWMKRQDRQQFIMAATDPQRLDRKHFALYTQGDRLVFIHRQEKNSGSVLCKSRFTWTPKIFDVKWHHVVVTVDGCNVARLFVDSKEISTVRTKEDWPLRGMNMANQLVIGARWLGRERKYADYFEGYLAGISINIDEAVSEEAIKCVFECKEKIDIASPIPDGFEVKQESHDVIEINGRGRAETFEKLLQGLVYINTRRSPTSGRRPLQIQATMNKKSLLTINMDIIVDSEDSPKMNLSGAERKMTDVAELRKYGIPIAQKLTIAAGKCAKYLDFAWVRTDPPLTTDETLVNPGPLLDLFHLKKENLPDGKGFVIRGLATIEEYQKVLREVVFVHLAPTENIFHKFKFSVSDMNQRYVSNVMKTEVMTAKKPHYDMQAISRQEKDALPGAVTNEILVAKTSGKSLGVVVGVVIAASCLFVFAILVIVIRLRSQETSVVYTDVPGNEAETSAEEKTSMNVTMNPLEILEKLDLPVEEKNGEESEPVLKTKKEKMTLEWDDAYIA